MGELNLSKGVRSIRVLQNTSWIDNYPLKPTIRITERDKEWTAAYSNWMDGKPPSRNEEWKKGVFLHFEPIQEQDMPEVKYTPPTTMSYITVGCKLVLLTVTCAILGVFHKIRSLIFS